MRSYLAFVVDLPKLLPQDVISDVHVRQFRIA